MEGKSSGPSCSGLNLVAHPRAKSKVWKYFGFDTDADGCILHWKRIYCRVCMSQIAYSGNTSNLSYHLEKNHPVEFSEFVKSNTDQMREAFATAFSRIKTEPLSLHPQPAQEPAVRPALSYENRRHNDLTLAVVNFICKGLYPASVVEEPTFKSLLSAADPAYSPPSKSDVALKMLPQMYCRTRDAVFSELAGMANCGITTDLWQSQSQNRTYISLSVHSVSHGGAGGFTMTNKCLKTFEVQEDNTAENITRAMYEAFVEWGITHKVSGATTNGSVDIVKACSLLELSVKMPCLGHSINRAMDEAFQLPRVESLLACCRKLAEHFREPTTYLLREKQVQFGLSQSALVTDRGGSWLSTLAMLQRLKEQQVALAAALLETTGSNHFSMDSPDWTLLEGLTEVLKPFKVVTKMMSSCRYPTISMVRPVLHMLLNSTLKVKEGDLKEISMTKEVISKVLSNTYLVNSPLAQEISSFLNVAAFLDPRYKKLPFLSNQERSKVESNIIEEAKAILEKQISGQPALDDFSVVSDEPPSKKRTPQREPSGSSSTQDNPLAAIFCQSDAEQSQGELHAQVVEELSNYKSQRVLGLNEDPLCWWSSHAALFPTLPKVLQKYWCVPATSVPCVRLFSSSGTVLCGKRNRIAPALVDQQVFLYENLRSYYEAEVCDDDADSVGEGSAVLPKQNGRVAIVTGGTRGMGFETAKHLAGLGMHVIIAGNEREEGAAAVRKIHQGGCKGRAEFVYLDLTSLKSVRQFAQNFKARGLPLHVLVNNAGTMLVPELETEDGFEFHFCLNYLGHFLLSNLLLDTLKASGQRGSCARIVNMSSATHYAGIIQLDDLNRRECYSSHGAYAQSKLALVLFTYYLQEKLSAGGSWVTVNAVDPGMVDTALYDNLWSLAQALKRPVAKILFRTPAEGASISIYAAAASEMEGVGSCYLYNGEKRQSAKASYDHKLQATMWRKSCELVGIQA